MSDEEFQVVSIPVQRRFSLDAGRMGRNRHIIYGLAEIDVTVARRFIRGHEAATGEKLSFTAYIVYCLAKAIDRHKEIHAYRNWRGQLVIFEAVNIVIMVEVTAGGRRVPSPYVLKAANRKTFRQIHDEIRAIQSKPQAREEQRFTGWFLRLPWPLRRMFYWTAQRFPQHFRDMNSSVLVTAVGMFSRGASWAITKPSHTLTLALGGIAEKPGVVDGRIEVREYLHLTLSVDHDIVDGAPIARFGRDFATYVEEGYGLAGQDGPYQG
jgi:pyruvate/2-oxoglutarate dehydrogenase complex dihydrolipoamide acyltransferase (E2) component